MIRHTDENMRLLKHRDFRHRGVTHPASIFHRWSREEKLAIGIFEVVRDPVPEGEMVVRWRREMAGDHVREVPVLESQSGD